MFPITAHPGVLLIADDDEDMRVMFRTLMAARGHRVLEASSGAQCVEMARGGGAELVVLDLRMPGMDGFGVAARLREDPATASLPVLAVTALADAEARRMAIEAGCDDVLVKPFSPRALMAQVEMLLLRSRIGTGPAAARPDTNPRSAAY